MQNWLERNSFLNRLSTLQRLCSESDSNYPHALLFVAGSDGRNNKGSITILKYLIFGSVGKELLDETIDPEYEPLEELVLLITESSVSVIWTHQMKELLTPLFCGIPFLIEYLTTAKEEAEIDLTQARKCCDFKRMILSTVPEGGGVGIPVPLGYDDILDIESWPIIQAFAMDSVYCPTGFFTARYAVADITTHIDLLFHTVDSYYVENAVRTVERTIVPHMQQAIAILDTSTADQRTRIIAEDAVGPLDILFEFGEMDASGTVDPSTRPVVLFGSESAYIGAAMGHYPADWQQMSIGNSSHAVYEGCEPSTGLRWCRTYFLRQGRCVELPSAAREAALSGATRNVEDGVKTEDSKNDSEFLSIDHSFRFQVDKKSAAVTTRLKALYSKLWITMRFVVKSIFLKHHDILEAGKEVQLMLEQVLRGTKDVKADWDSLVNVMGLQQLDTADTYLSPHEKLQVHMDCMNALGEIITIEDVDDMGGSCWTYIRVTVHGVSIGLNDETVSIAVGDTFLFSSHTTSMQLLMASLQGRSKVNQAEVSSVMGDCSCITQGIPYYRCYMATGPEEKSAQQLLSIVRSIHLLPYLGLGQPVEHSAVGVAGLLNLSLLTDDPLLPFANCDIRLFSEGFIIDKVDHISCLPTVVSIANNVDRVWTVDASECMQQASKFLPRSFLMNRNLPDINVPSGLLILIRLRQDTDGRIPLSYISPLSEAWDRDYEVTEQQPHHIALFVATSARQSSAVMEALTSWRRVMRYHEIQEHRGDKDVSLPEQFLKVFLMAVDSWSKNDTPLFISKRTAGRGINMDTGMLTESSGSSIAALPEAPSLSSLVSTANYFAENPRVSVPGTGLIAMIALHNISDSIRLARIDYQESETVAAVSSDSVVANAGNELIILCGMAGSGVQLVANQWMPQIQQHLNHVSKAIGFVEIDLSLLLLDNNTAAESKEDDAKPGAQTHSCEDVISFLCNCAKDQLQLQQLSDCKSYDVMLVSIIDSAAVHIDFPDLIGIVARALQAHRTTVFSTICPSIIDTLNDSALSRQKSYAERTAAESGKGLGEEFWSATGLELLQAGCCQAAVIVDEHGGTSTAAYDNLRTFIADANPGIDIIRLSPTLMRVNDEDLDFILKLAGMVDSNVAGSEQVVARVGRHEQELIKAIRTGMSRNLWRSLPSDSAFLSTISTIHPRSCSGLVDANFSVVRITAASIGVKEWNLRNAIAALQELLPQARLVSTAVDDTWKAPPLPVDFGQKGSFYRRLLALAKAKVLCARQNNEGQQVFRSKLKLLIEKNLDDFEKMIHGIRSIHGSLYMPAGIRTQSALEVGSESDGSTNHMLYGNVCAYKALVEGNQQFIALRAQQITASATERGHDEVLIFQGCFSATQVVLLKEMMKICAQYRLKPKPYLTIDDIPKSVKVTVQNTKKYSEAHPLPGGWWFDGMDFVDINGTRQLLRPDIDHLLELYLSDENKKIEEYNDIIAEL